MEVNETEIREKIKHVVEKAGYYFINNGSQPKNQGVLLCLGYKSSFNNYFDVTFYLGHVIRVTFADDTKNFTDMDEMLRYIERKIKSNGEK